MGLLNQFVSRLYLAQLRILLSLLGIRSSIHEINRSFREFTCNEHLILYLLFVSFAVGEKVVAIFLVLNNSFS